MMRLVGLFLWLIRLGASLLIVAVMHLGDPELLAFLPLFVLLVFPWSILRRVLAPRGSVRASYYLAQLSDVGFGNDPAGGAAFAAALALLRRPDADEVDVRWVERKLSELKPLRAGGLVAAALLRLRAGDDEGARQLFASVEMLGDVPALALRVSREWLAADAASRGDWAEVVAITERPSVAACSRATLLLGSVARRLLRRPDAPSDERLWLRWLLAPERRLTRPLVQRALAVPPALARLDDPASDAPAPPDADPLRGALLLQVRLQAPDAALLPADLAHLGAAWDRALTDPALDRRLLIRSTELGAPQGMKLKEQLGEMAAAEVARFARERGVPLGEIDAPGLTLERAARRLRDELLSGVEAASEAMRRRAIDRRELPSVDEWREWLSLRRRYEHTARMAGPQARRLAWPKVRDDVCKMAVWLWNTRDEKTIANAMFRWLLDEATAMDDQEAIDLQKKNVGCGT